MHEFDLALRGAVVVRPKGQERADVGVKDGRIVAVGEVGPAAKEVDLNELHLMPGAIDTQVHFREPGMEHKEDIAGGTLQALHGGVTTIFEMPNTNPTTTTEEALRDKLRRAEGRAWVDHGFFVGASESNVDHLGQLERLPGVPGIKVFMGSSTGTLLVETDELLRQVMRNGSRPMPVHSEDEPLLRKTKAEFQNPTVEQHHLLRPVEAAVRSTKRLIALCEETGRHVHVLHISTADELPLLAEAKRRGLPVTCEATPQHLFLDSSLYGEIGTLAQMNPPLRDPEHRAAILQAFQDGLFDVMGSDHAPHTLEEKAKPYPASPSGMPGVQAILSVAIDAAARGLWKLEDVTRFLSARPAELYGIKNKGQIAPGRDADLVAVDLKAQTTIDADWIKAKCGWSPWEGRTFQGRIRHVWLRGELALGDGEPVGQPKGRPAEFDWK